MRLLPGQLGKQSSFKQGKRPGSIRHEPGYFERQLERLCTRREALKHYREWEITSLARIEREPFHRLISRVIFQKIACFTARCLTGSEREPLHPARRENGTQREQLSYPGSKTA